MHRTQNQTDVVSNPTFVHVSLIHAFSCLLSTYSGRDPVLDPVMEERMGALSLVRAEPLMKSHPRKLQQLSLVPHSVCSGLTWVVDVKGVILHLRSSLGWLTGQSGSAREFVFPGGDWKPPVMEMGRRISSFLILPRGATPKPVPPSPEDPQQDGAPGAHSHNLLINGFCLPSPKSLPRSQTTAFWNHPPSKLVALKSVSWGVVLGKPGLRSPLYAGWAKGSLFANQPTLLSHVPVGIRVLM